MSEQPVDHAYGLAVEIQLTGEDLLMVTMYPGQPEHVVPTPRHISRQLVHGKMLASIPFHREATSSEYAAYLREHGLDAL
ncbi:hypothetical protein ABID97_003639 [Variovorax sp. OAS795]